MIKQGQPVDDRGIVVADYRSLSGDSDRGGHAQEPIAPLITWACRCRVLGPGIDAPSERRQLTAAHESADAGARKAGAR